MAPPKFKDLGKKPNDIILDDSKYESKCEVKTAAKGLNLTSCFTREDTKGIKGSLEAKGKLADFDITTNLKDDSTLTVSVENTTLVQGLKLKVDTAPVTLAIQKVSFEYKHDLAFLTGLYDHSAKDGPKVDLSAAFAGNGFSGGISASKVDPKNLGSAKPEFALQYDASDYTLHAFCKESGKNAGGSAMYKVNSDTTVAVKVAQKEAKLDIALGGTYSVDTDTDVSVTVSQDRMLRALIESKISPALKIKGSAMLNADKMSGHKWGLEMLYSL
eukprot:CAMPEP_0181324570 /NCGR_PEP_ID=MMETSP1101-20121128/20434_1 /TAXON_ID=46948 /ORGANISM="Rhodomonas abbreviata, Strain Caron Lab Isolate" /LENGTH=272 /DNA_ID=CAMNT_0023432763 /DNA_START=50 /DNA_END=868 /DNA_ORIENTATION=-